MNSNIVAETVVIDNSIAELWKIAKDITISTGVTWFSGNDIHDFVRDTYVANGREKRKGFSDDGRKRKSTGEFIDQPVEDLENNSDEMVYT